MEFTFKRMIQVEIEGEAHSVELKVDLYSRKDAFYWLSAKVLLLLR